MSYGVTLNLDKVTILANFEYWWYEEQGMYIIHKQFIHNFLDS